jgi:hypothetical protein
MGWIIVKQPDGRFCRFSSVVDDLTHCNMSESDALEVCTEYMGKYEAPAKVQAGIDDLLPYNTIKKGDGSARWNDIIETIECVHGKEGLKKTLELINNLPRNSTL